MDWSTTEEDEQLVAEPNKVAQSTSEGNEPTKQKSARTNKVDNLFCQSLATAYFDNQKNSTPSRGSSSESIDNKSKRRTT